MPKSVCRITWRKGEPLSLAVYPSTTFLDLPGEIRGRIYYDAPIASRPITVSSVAIHEHESRQNDAKQTIISQECIVEGRDPILDQIATSLLRCHLTIAPEAAAFFYQWNTFHFEGNEVWNPFYSFLQSIRDYNRGFLRNLSAKFEIRKHVYQDRYGARIIRHFPLPFHIIHSSAGHPPPWVEHPRRRTDHEYRPFQYLDLLFKLAFAFLAQKDRP
jgi:hypothetical protein